MGKIIDFHCKYENGGLGEWAENLDGISFPQAYTEVELMAELANKVREHEGARFCKLPFCHTLEAEALGGEIRLGNAVTGPRAGNFRYRSLEEILEIPEIDMESTLSVRLRNILSACKKLSDSGEPVMFLVSGLYTILNGLIDPMIVYRAALKKPEILTAVLEKIEKDILKVMKLAEEAGASYLSYADPAGGVGIVGPKLAEWTAKNFTEKLLREADWILRPETIVLLCPKTSYALIGADMAEWKERKLPHEMEYLEAVEYFHRRQAENMEATDMLEKGKVRFAGQDCINRNRHKLPNGIFKELVLNEAGEK